MTASAPRIALAAAAVLLASTACGAQGRAAPADPPLPSVEADCGGAYGVHLKPIWLHTSDAQRLYAIHGGAGPTGVVLVPESPPGDVCGWLPYAATLERAGMRVVVFDYRGTGDSPVQKGRPTFAYGRDLTAAIAQLRADGARRVAVVGASFGAAVAMTYASGVDAVVSLSGETTLPQYHLDPLDAVSHLHAPLLIVGSRADTYLPMGDAQKLLYRAGSSTKRLVLYPNSWHGWQIVEAAPYRRRARAVVLAWLRAKTS
jgi:dienelactone hydrolase